MELTAGSFELGGVGLRWFWSSFLELTAGSFEVGGANLSWFRSSFLELATGSFEFGAGVRIRFSERVFVVFRIGVRGAL